MSAISGVPVPNLFAFLIGRWSLRRSRLDRRAGGTLLTVSGTAQWKAALSDTVSDAVDGALSASAPQMLLYSELGELRRAGAPPTSTRAAARWMSVPGVPSAARVAFDDGRPFHALDLASGECTVTHACSPDDYVGRFSAGEAALTIVWHVTGPAKDYTSTTELTRDSS